MKDTKNIKATEQQRNRFVSGDEFELFNFADLNDETAGFTQADLIAALAEGMKDSLDENTLGQIEAIKNCVPQKA